MGAQRKSLPTVWAIQFPRWVALFVYGHLVNVLCHYYYFLIKIKDFNQEGIA